MKGNKLLVKRVSQTEFELEDGRVFEHPVELDGVPAVEEFQKILEYWKKVFDGFLSSEDLLDDLQEPVTVKNYYG